MLNILMLKSREVEHKSAPIAFIFGAQSLTNPGKGADWLLRAISSLSSSRQRERGEEIEQATEMVTVNLGYISSDRLKSIAYSAADLSLFPTRADNSPLVLLESLACPAPMVSFNIGGVGDLVRLGVTGYLAQPEDAQDLCHDLLELLEDDNLWESMGKKGRAIARKEYPLELQAQRYIELDRQILSSRAQN